MRIMRRMSITIIAICSLYSSRNSIAQTDASAIISQLQNPTTSDNAVKEIEAGDSNLKNAVAEKLPSLMINEKNDIVLNNESKLAGDLKVVACVPILVRIFAKGDLLPTGLTSTMRWHMDDDPAGHALAQIGDPVIPFMSKFLTSNERDDREKAIRVLGNIKSPAAIDALKQHRSSESDKHLQHVIDSVAPQN